MSEETHMPAGGKGKHASQQEAEGNMQGRRREKEACKGGGGRGRHAREAEVEEGIQGRLR